MPSSGSADPLGRRPAQAESLLAVLATNDVEFLLVGGLAVQAHGYVRSTFDVDILPRPDRDNLARLAEVLGSIDARVVTSEGDRLPITSEPESLAIGDYALTTSFGALDLVNGPRPDLKRYERLASSAIVAELDGFSVSIVGRDDLIAMKRQAGREKDLADISALTETERSD